MTCERSMHSLIVEMWDNIFNKNTIIIDNPNWSSG